MWRTAKYLYSIQRTLNQIERLGESLEGKLFDFPSRCLRRNVAKPHHWLGASTDQLNRSVFSRQNRQSQHFLSIDHSSQGSDRIFRSDQTSYINDTANVIGHVSSRSRGRFPQFALWQSQWMETGFASFKPLPETSVFLLRHWWLPRAGVRRRPTAGRSLQSKVRQDRPRL